MYIDLTKTIYDDIPTYKGDPKVSLKQIASIEKDGYTNFELHTSMHVSTHIDGPFHMKPNGANIASFDLEQFIGLGKKIKSREPYQYEGEEILFIEHSGFLPLALIKEITTNPIKAIVIEGDSPDELPYPIHHLLMEKQIFIVENATDFVKLPNKRIFKAYIIPLKIEADSSPCRLFVEI